MLKKCNVCEANQKNVNRLIITDTGFSICDNCIKLFYDSLLKEKEENKKTYDTNIDPIELKTYLDQYVVGQDDAKKILSVAIANHFKRIQSDDFIEKSNVIILGPTGSGKTYMLEVLAKCLDIPFVIADVTNITETGYVGEDVDSILTGLYQQSNNNILKAETGIVFLDEIDKLSRRHNDNTNHDISGIGVQQTLLKLVEGATYNVPVKIKSHKTVQINTKNILFIASGAFVGLDIIKKQTSDNARIGFLASTTSESLETNFNHLIEFGMIPEFVGRFPIITEIQHLNKTNMFDILTKVKYNLIGQYQNLFKYNDISLILENDLIEDIVEKAIKMKTGARGLRSVMEKTLLPYMFNMNNYQKDNIKVLRISINDINTAINQEVKNICQQL